MRKIFWLLCCFTFVNTANFKVYSRLDPRQPFEQWSSPLPEWQRCILLIHENQCWLYKCSIFPLPLVLGILWYKTCWTADQCKEETKRRNNWQGKKLTHFAPLVLFQNSREGRHLFYGWSLRIFHHWKIKTRSIPRVSSRYKHYNCCQRGWEVYPLRLPRLTQRRSDGGDPMKLHGTMCLD